MKTIKLPKTAPRYHLTCSNANCEAVMEATKDDLRFVSDQRDGDAYALICPHCGKETWFSSLCFSKHEVRFLPGH